MDYTVFKVNPVLSPSIMLIVNIIYATKFEENKRREKLRFLTRESVHMRNLLSKYAEVILANLMKRMREREAMQRQLAGD